jgi:hypothetical protein
MNIAEIVANKAELIQLKKAEVKTVKGGISSIIKTANTTIKGVFKDNEGSLERTIVGNTYLWMDSHNDVHAKGCFTKSVKENKSIFHLHDHEFKLTSKVGEPKKTYEEEIAWKDLGVNKSGMTQALFMDTEIFKDYNSQIFNEYKAGRINQHSVGMQYVKIDLAVNDESFEKEFKVWQDNIDTLGNPEKATEKGFFWLVKEAKLIEISAVLLGSNELTPTQKEYKAMASNKNKDVEFIDMMIPHHEKAIEMANEYKKEIIDKDLKAIVDNIKSSQTDEINKMKAIKNKIQADKSLENIEEPSKDTQTIEVEKELLKELLNKF